MISYPSPEEGAALLRFAPHKPNANQIMTGNNSGARRLTMFVLTPAAANELFTVRRVAGFPRWRMAILEACLIVSRAGSKASSKKNSVATSSDFAHATQATLSGFPNTSMLCPDFASLPKSCDLNARNRADFCRSRISNKMPEDLGERKSACRYIDSYKRHQVAPQNRRY